MNDFDMFEIWRSFESQNVLNKVFLLLEMEAVVHSCPYKLISCCKEIMAWFVGEAHIWLLLEKRNSIVFLKVLSILTCLITAAVGILSAKTILQR